MKFSIVDGATAAALAQILPALLLAFTVERRRTALHRKGRRPGWAIAGLALFYVLFGLVEKPLSLSRSHEPVSKNSIEAARLT